MNIVECLYRYESAWHSGVDEWDNPGPSYCRIHELKFPIISETPKGCWIKDYLKITWVSNSSRKRYAHRTREAAKEAYIQRKKSYVKHQEARLKRAKTELALMFTEIKK